MKYFYELKIDKRILFHFSNLLPGTKLASKTKKFIKVFGFYLVPIVKVQKQSKKYFQKPSR